MKQTISVPIYYHIDDDNKIVIDYKQMKEEYNFKIERLKIETESTNKNTDKTMGNMSYCRFENTLGDLQDCHEALENIYDEIKDMSRYEKQSVIPFIELCKEIAYNHDIKDIQELIDNNEDEDN